MSQPVEKVSQVQTHAQERPGEQKREPKPMPKTDDEKSNADGAAEPSEKKGRVGQVVAYVGQCLLSSTFWTAVFTGILVYFTYLLYVVADQAGQTTRIIQRAWVIPKETTPLTLVPNQTMIVRITLENPGNTPAFNMTARVGSVLITTAAPFPADPYYPPPSEEPSQGIIAPHGIKFIDCVIDPLTVDDINRINEKSTTLYCYGKFLYSDPFTKGRPGTFCLYFVLGGSFNLCPTYNNIAEQLNNQ